MSQWGDSIGVQFGQFEFQSLKWRVYSGFSTKKYHRVFTHALFKNRDTFWRFELGTP